jgi:phosphoribosyl 1,2-cyclic phosphodiesterase
VPRGSEAHGTIAGAIVVVHAGVAITALDDRVTFVFLGSGASGGTPGRGRSRRHESSLWMRARTRVLIDVTRDFAAQARLVDSVDYVLLTHGHRDACGGMPLLRRWWRHRMDRRPIPVFASPDTIAVVRRRVRRLEHCLFVPVSPGGPVAPETGG